jgi:predicted small lipoprotein YifL
MKPLPFLLALALSLALTACGVKSDLVMPDGKPTKHGEQDPSKPPSPIGR